jgi:caa(3)-type oxidase subunit IV
LIALAVLSLLLSLQRWSRGDLVVSLVIALVKALLVLFIFMHLAEQRFSNRLVVLVSVLFVVLIVGLSAADVVSRRTFPERPAPAVGDPFYRR